MNQQNVTRITASGLGAALAVVLIWILQLLAGIEPPAEVVVAITTVITFITQVVIRKIGGEL